MGDKLSNEIGIMRYDLKELENAVFHLKRSNTELMETLQETPGK